MKTYRILIVDDEPKVAFFFQKHLEMAGDHYAVTAVNSGQEALAALQQHRYDLLITDLRMPHMDGLELLNRVRDVSPHTKTILVTAYGGRAVWEEAERLNTFRALSKPVKINDLLTAVRESLRQTSATPASGGIMALTGDTYKALNADLEELRINLGARAVVLADTAGQVLTSTGSLEALDISSTMALLGGTVGASNTLAAQLNFQQPTHLTFFEGPPYDLYVANVSEHFFVSIWQDRKQAGKIGMVWLYTQRTVEKITDMLETSIGEEALVGETFVTSVQSDLDAIFGSSSTAKPVRRATATKLKTPTLTTKVSQIVERFEKQTSIQVSTSIDPNLSDFPPAVNKLVLRTLAESLKNIYQHAEATEVQIDLYCDEECLMGRITDNGRGFDMMRPPTLNEMGDLQDLFRQRDGTLVLTGSPDNGTSVSFQLNGVSPS